MKLQALSETYAVRRLEPKDVERIYEMMRKNVMFYEYHPPFVTRESNLADMKALPPQKQEEDKLYVGFFDGEKLAAVLDLIVSYPDDSAAFIGFFMTDVQCQNQGVGTRSWDTKGCASAWTKETRRAAPSGRKTDFAGSEKKRMFLWNDNYSINCPPAAHRRKNIPPGSFRSPLRSDTIRSSVHAKPVR